MNLKIYKFGIKAFQMHYFKFQIQIQIQVFKHNFQVFVFVFYESSFLTYIISELQN